MGIETSKHANTFLPNTMDFGQLEDLLQQPNVTPICLPVEFLKAITCNFSNEKELGTGGYGVVYKVWLIIFLFFTIHFANVSMHHFIKGRCHY